MSFLQVGARVQFHKTFWLFLPFIGCDGAGFPILGPEDDAMVLEPGAGGVLATGGQGSGGQSTGSGPSSGGQGQAGEGPIEPPLINSWGPAQLLSFSNTEFSDQDVLVSASGLELYFSTTRGGKKSDIWLAKRASVEEEWAEPQAVLELNTAESEATPELFASDTRMLLSRSDGTKYSLYESRRADVDSPWEAPVLLSGLGGDVEGLSPTMSADGLTLFFNRAGENLDVDVLVATRLNIEQSFGEPSLLNGLNSPENDWDLTTHDGLSFVFSRDGELIFAQRVDVESPFEPLIPLSSVNTTFREFDPWLSSNEAELLFSSDRDGTERIYRVLRD